MKTYTVYKLTSPSGKSYVGWTGRKLKKRLQDHISEVRRGLVRPIQNALRKYSLDLWDKEILVETKDYTESLKAEVHFINQFQTTDPSKGYNISTGGECGASGVTRSEEVRQKIREGKQRSFWRSTPEHGAKISAALKGHPSSEKQKQATVKARARIYSVVFPDGSVHEIYNLNSFCRDMGLDAPNLRTSSSKGYRLHK
jgi:group I intron endonuclease